MTVTRQPTAWADRAAMQAVAGIGAAFLSVRLRGASADPFGFGLAWSDALSLTLADDAHETFRHASGDGRALLDHAVTVRQTEVTASLSAIAEVPRRGAAIAGNRLTLSLAVMNAGPAPLSAHLWLAWSGMMPGHPVVPSGLAGDIAVAALVRDRQEGFARFLSTISCPVAGDRKAGSTAPGGAGEPGIYTAALPPHGFACGGCSPDVSEEPLVLASLAPGERRVLTWQVAIEAEARAGVPDPRAPQPVLLSRRGLALTGEPRAS